MGLENVQIWSGGVRVHRVSLREQYLAERHRLLFKLSMTEDEKKRQAIKEKLVEIEVRYQQNMNTTGYSLY